MFPGKGETKQRKLMCDLFRLTNVDVVYKFNHKSLCRDSRRCWNKRISVSLSYGSLPSNVVCRPGNLHREA